MSDITRSEALKELKEYVEGLDMEYATPFDKAILFAISSLETDEAYQLEYERTTKNDLEVDCNNCKNNFHRGDGTTYCATGDGMCHYECEESTTKNDLGVDAISRKALLDATVKKNSVWNIITNSEGDNLETIIAKLPSVTPQEPRWIPVSERVAEFPCLACDIFEQIFIPIGIVVLNSRCYEGKDFAFNVEKFLKGKEVTLFGGEKVYEPPREIVAWMPLPKAYKEVEEC